VSRWFFAAEKEKETDCPGNITGGVPVPLNVPVSTNGLLFNTFSMVMVDCVDILSSFLSQDARHTRINSIVNVRGMLCFMVN
jgi:hypothetical protein